MTRSPIAYWWDNKEGVLRPVGRHFLRMAQEQFEHGKVVRLGAVEERSMRSHAHYFACINQAWANLGDEDQMRFPSPTHLRRWAETFTEFCTLKIYHAKSKREAMRVADYVQGEFDRVVVDGKTVFRYIPHSQSLASMPANKTFQRSKSQVLDVLAQRLSVSVEELKSAGKSAA